MCDKALSGCSHHCPVACHDNVEVKVEVEGSMKAATPWEAVHTGTVGGVRREVKATECPPCQVNKAHHKEMAICRHVLLHLQIEFGTS